MNQEIIAVSLSRLREVLDYDQSTGVFRWKLRGKIVAAGSIAGAQAKGGYRQIYVDGRLYRSHRLAWFYVHGRWPAEQIDHINGVRDDNRIKNLREATRSENAQNRALNKNNTSGYLGVSFNKERRTWRASICVNSKQKNLGSFLRKRDAARAYKKAKEQLHTFQPKIRINTVRPTRNTMNSPVQR